MMRLLGTIVGLLAFAATAAVGQDTTVVEQGVRVGITYTPGVRPGLLVLGGERVTVLDSVRAMVARDLEYSDEFEIIALPMGDSMSLRIAREPGDGESAPYVNYPLYAALGADYAVDVYPDAVDGTPTVSMFNVGASARQREIRVDVTSPGDPEFRLAVHRAADELVRSVTGQLGVAASRLLFVNRGRVYRVDSDGAEVRPISEEGVQAMSPSWAPDGRRMIYMEFPSSLYEHVIATGRRTLVPVTSEAQNFTPVYAPDGETIAFSRATNEGTDVYTYNLAAQCCLQRLTVGRLYDNLSPTFSPDGRRIAFISNRPGLTQVYVMGADGTGQELFAPFEWGVTGSSNAPEWSPDGRYITFHREVERSPQIFVMDVATQTVRQLTSAGRNYDPTWAPDNRHVAFVSERTGSRQVWIIDIETGRVRQLTRLGEARLPSWSPRITAPIN
jgi:TolB protein